MNARPTPLQAQWCQHLTSELLGLHTPVQVWQAYQHDCNGRLSLLRWHSLAVRTALQDFFVTGC